MVTAMSHVERDIGLDADKESNIVSHMLPSLSAAMKFGSAKKLIKA